MARTLAIVLVLLWPSSALAQSERATHLALGAYITTAFADSSVTSFCYGRGTCRELNPVLRPIIEQHNVVVAMTVKGAMHATIAGLLLKAHTDHPRRVFWLTVGLTAAQLAVDVQNVRVTR